MTSENKNKDAESQDLTDPAPPAPAADQKPAQAPATNPRKNQRKSKAGYSAPLHPED